MSEEKRDEDKPNYANLQTRDYGFDLNPKYTKDSTRDLVGMKNIWMKTYEASIQKQLIEWSKDESKTDRIKGLTRLGIPALRRPPLWFDLSGSASLLKQLPTYYEDNLKHLDESKCIKDIDRDINRTFVSHPYFRDVEGQQTLRRCLLVYSLRRPEIGYCQSMNYIVGILLLFYSERDAFIMLTTILENILPKDYYSQNMIGAQVDCLVFKKLLKRKLNKVYKHLLSFEIDVNVVSLPWFVCLYSTSLPIESIMRVWDSIFKEGDKILFRVALAIFKLHTDRILELNDMHGLIKYIGEMSLEMFDIDLLMSTAFHKIGSLSKSTIARLRKKYRARLETKPPK